MTDDVEYLANYKKDTLYLNPGKDGVYATMVGESEEFIGEIDVGTKFKLCLSAFYVNQKEDFNSFKLIKLKYHNTYGWREDGQIKINRLQLAHLKECISIISSLDLKDTEKTKLSFGDLDIGSLKTILDTDKGAELLRELANEPTLHEDIYAISQKKSALETFGLMLENGHSEPEWQAFFEENPWIFGHGLSYIFNEKVASKLECTTTGASFDTKGKRVDALMKTRAEISQYVLVEIKKPTTELLDAKEYRSGCWNASSELSGAVAQIQKTTYEFTKNRLKDEMKDDLGNGLNQYVYSIEPKSYLVVGSLSELVDNEDRIICFELFRRNIHSPEIITFDELYERAKCIVENIGGLDNERR